jgi:hypothetical protein
MTVGVRSRSGVVSHSAQSACCSCTAVRLLEWSLQRNELAGALCSVELVLEALARRSNRIRFRTSRFSDSESESYYTVLQYYHCTVQTNPGLHKLQYCTPLESSGSKS